MKITTIRYLLSFPILFSSFSLLSHSFVYPVAQCGNDKIFVIYQKSPMQLELWIWDIQKAYAFKGLSSHIVPAGFRLLPSGNGFSFIDQGRIRIKHFGRRAPKSIEVSEPIYDITLIEWISDTMCYLSARKHNSYGIYHMYASGTVIPIIQHDACVDCMYPQKQDDSLFYIQRTKASDMLQRNNLHHYSLVKTKYPHLPEQEDIAIDHDALASTGNMEPSIIIDNHKTPLIFLRMVSEYEGYVIEHQATIDEDDTYIECVYHHIYYQDNEWHMMPLLYFSLPINLLFAPQERLYESILPLLPYHVGSTIYYVDCSHAKHGSILSIFSYNMTNKKVTQLTHQSHESVHHFGLCKLNNIMYYGGSLDGDLCYPEHCTPSSEGFVNFNLGMITLPE